MTKRVCPACEGTGWLWIWPCDVCRGSGTVEAARASEANAATSKTKAVVKDSGHA